MTGCKEPDAWVQGIYDNAFEQGFLISDTDGTAGDFPGRLDWAGSAADPVWRIAQWWCKYDLADPAETEQTCSDGAYIYRNQGAAVSVVPGSGEISLELSGSAHYGGVPRKEGEAWPSILLDQYIAENFRLAELNSLYFDIAFTVTRFEDNMPGQADPALHSAQFQWIVTVQNINAGAGAAYRDYFWFGLPFFDARYAYPKAYESVDAGKADATGKYSCFLGGEEFLSEPVRPNRRVRVRFDVLPAIRAAFAGTQAAGYMKHTKYEDLSVGAMNVGWEVTGIYDVGVTIHKISMEIGKESGER